MPTNDIFGVEREFSDNVKGHKLEVLKDDGLYRHLRFSRGGSSVYHFDIITWPYHLCYTGDMGTYVFMRDADMLSFFRCDNQRYRVNPSYWSEKLISIDKGSPAKEFDEEGFKKGVFERMVEWFRENRSQTTKEYRREIYETIKSDVLCDNGAGGNEKLSALYNCDVPSDIFVSDITEFHCERFTYHFMWCCFAIVWAIEVYDKWVLEAMLDRLQARENEEKHK